MEITFVSASPHQKARPLLDDLLLKGTDRIMIACAFCTGAGVVILQRHLARLKMPGSCLVVSSEPPTDIAAVNELATAAPGKVWIHATGDLPNEKKVGSALMHSKVFYAEAGDKCWLWVGSHNLTGRATEGANLEAAVVLSGHPTEAPFVAAREHIQACRNESSPCPVQIPPMPDGESVNLVVIHAETEKLPGRSAPWHVRIGLRSADYDWLLKPVVAVRLHLYHIDALAAGWQAAVPWASYHGTLTGLNLTDRHPNDPGIPAEWSDEHYAIIDENAVLRFSETAGDTSAVVTQAVINIDGPAAADEMFLSAKPKTETDEQTGNYSLEMVDGDLVRFFTPASIEAGKLVYQLKMRGEPGWRIPLEDLRPKDRLLIASEAMTQRVAVRPMEMDDSGGHRHPLIMRAKFRLRKRGLS